MNGRLAYLYSVGGRFSMWTSISVVIHTCTYFSCPSSLCLCIFIFSLILQSVEWVLHKKDIKMKLYHINKQFAWRTPVSSCNIGYINLIFIFVFPLKLSSSNFREGQQGAPIIQIYIYNIYMYIYTLLYSPTNVYPDKAFDYIQSDILSKVMNDKGYDQSIIKPCISYLTNRKQNT